MNISDYSIDELTSIEVKDYVAILKIYISYCAFIFFYILLIIPVAIAFEKITHSLSWLDSGSWGLYLIGIFNLVYISWFIWIFKKTWVQRGIKDKVFELYNYYQASKSDDIESIENIISKLQKIKKHIKFLRYTKFLQFLYDADSRAKIRILLRLSIHLCLAILIDMKGDLQNNMSQQKEALEWARNELLTHIWGIQELKQGAEIQKVRINRQIEQFEELQKVLV